MIGSAMQHYQGRIFSDKIVQQIPANEFFLPIAIGRNFHSTIKELNMNMDRFEGNWKQLKGKVKHLVGRLSDDQFLAMEGKRDQLAGIIQESNGISRETAEKQNAAMARVSER